MGVDLGGWGGWGGGEFALFFLFHFLFFLGVDLDGWISKSGSSEAQSFSGEEGGVEGEAVGGAGRKKPVMVATNFALLSWNSFVGLRQEGLVRGVVKLWAVLGKGGGRGGEGMGMMEFR